MHGGHEGGGHHGGGDMGGGMGPGGGMDHGGGMGPDSEGGENPGAENELAKPVNPETTPDIPEETPTDQNRQFRDGNDQGLDISPADNNPGGE
jgi:hypothetical protein